MPFVISNQPQVPVPDAVARTVSLDPCTDTPSFPSITTPPLNSPASEFGADVRGGLDKLPEALG